MDILEIRIMENKIDEAIKLISEIGREKDVSAVPLLIKYLNSTDNNLLRNAIAIALSDIGSIEAIEHIVALVKNPKTQGNRGTLLYALEGFDVSNHFETFVDLLSDDGFEVSRQALCLIQVNINNISGLKMLKFVHQIESEIERLEEKLDFLSEALDILKRG